MRENLAAYAGKTITNVGAIFSRFGYKRGFGNALSVLLNNVSYEGEMLTEHAWVSCKDEFKDVEINHGDFIVFDCCIGAYSKVDGSDYGIEKIENIRVIKRSGHEVTIDDVKYFSFFVREKRDVWSHIKGSKSEFVHDASREIQKDITIVPGDQIEIELEKIDERGYMVFAWKVKSHGRWNKNAMFNPLKSGQALIIYGQYQIFLPDTIYFLLKDFYFKYKFSKPNVELPFYNEMVHYEKPQKFKHRYFINYDENGDMIQDEELIEKRLNTFNRREEIMRSMTDDEIFDFTQEVFGSVVYIRAYKAENSDNYQNYDFLITKMLNTFNSADDKGKSRFLRIMLEREERKGAQE